jgi:hypothetical protein
MQRSGTYEASQTVLVTEAGGRGNAWVCRSASSDATQIAGRKKASRTASGWTRRLDADEVVVTGIGRARLHLHRDPSENWC